MGSPDTGLPPFPAVGDHRVRLRDWLAADLPCVRAASSDAAIPTMTSVPTPWDDQAGRAFIERQRGRRREGLGWALAVEDLAEGRAVGFVGVWLDPPGEIGPLARLGYWMDPDVRGHGLMAAGVRAAVRGAALLGIEELRASVDPANPASQRVVRTCGFRPTGCTETTLITGRPAETRPTWARSTSPSVGG